MFYYRTFFDKDRQILLEKQSVYAPDHVSPKRILSKEDAYEICTKVLHMHLLTEEYVYCFCLDTTVRMQGYFEVSHGTVNSSVVSPREIMQKCLLTGAASFLLAHNHPSGSCSASKEDLAITKRLRDAGMLMGIPLQDHLIIGENCYCSIRSTNPGIWTEEK